MRRPCFNILLIIAIVLASLLSCDAPSSSDGIDADALIVWQGSFSSAPADPEPGWAYYDTSDGASYIFLQGEWRLLAQDGLDINWLGELSSAPSDPSRNDAYFNTTDGNSYIYDGQEWDYLARRGADGAAGSDGASGILKWYGDRDSAISDPVDGDAYHNTIDRCSYIFYSGSWHVLSEDGYGLTWIGVFDSAPSGPHTLNDVYFNLADKTTYIWNGTIWEKFLESSGSGYINVPIEWKGNLSSAPSDPEVGWVYYNTSLGCTYIYDGAVWEQIAKDGYSPEGFLIQWQGTLSNAPSNPEQGWAYYNSNTNCAYLYDGNRWNLMVQGSTGGSGSVIPAEQTEIEILVDGKVPVNYSSINIGNLEYGYTQPLTSTIEVRNIGDNDLVFQMAPSVTSYSNGFTADYSLFPSRIAPDESAIMTVTYAPPKDHSYNPSYPIGFVNLNTYASNAIVPDGYTGSLMLYATSEGPAATLSLAGTGGLSASCNVGIAYNQLPSSLTIADMSARSGKNYFQLTAMNSNQNGSIVRNISFTGADASCFDYIGIDQVTVTSQVAHFSFTPDTIREYECEIEFDVDYRGETIHMSAPLTIDVTSVTSSFFNDGIAYFDGGEGDGADYLDVMFEGSDGYRYIVGRAYEAVSDSSEDDLVIIRLDKDDEISETYAFDEYKAYEDGFMRSDGKIVLFSSSFWDVFDLESRTIEKAEMDDNQRFLGISNGNIIYIDEGNRYDDNDIEYYLYVYNENRVLNYSIIVERDSIDKILDVSIGPFSEYSECLVASGYGYDLMGDNSGMDATGIWFPLIDDSPIQSSGHITAWDNGHSDDEQATSILLNDGDIFLSIYQEDDISGWISGYTIKRIDGIDGTESNLRIGDVPKADLYAYDGNIYVDCNDFIAKLDFNDASYDIIAARPSRMARRGSLLFSDGCVYMGGYGSALVAPFSNSDWYIIKTAL